MDAEDKKPVPEASEQTSEDSAQRSRSADPVPGRTGETGPPIAPLEVHLFGEEVPRPPATLQRLMKRLERGGGPSMARLAELALRAGITVPRRPAETHGSGGLETALWMELARENATLRREADKLAERQETLSRRIHRAKERLRELRLKVIQRRTGLTKKELLNMPSPPTWQELDRQHPKGAGAKGDTGKSSAEGGPARGGGGAPDEEGHE
jgi:hypothetical protein